MEFNEGPIDGVLIRPVNFHKDNRGWLAELYRIDELSFSFQPAMSYVSMTHPGVKRGPHAHKEQTDCFVFVLSEFRVSLWDARPQSPTFGNRMTIKTGYINPLLVIVPPMVVHAYENISAIEGLVFNFPDRLYAGKGKKEPVDEIRYEDIEDSPYKI